MYILEVIEIISEDWDDEQGVVGDSLACFGGYIEGAFDTIEKLKEHLNHYFSGYELNEDGYINWNTIDDGTHLHNYTLAVYEKKQIRI